MKAGKHIVFDFVADFDGIAADFTIFDVDLAGNGEVQDHGDFFPAVGAHESVFHGELGYDRFILNARRAKTRTLESEGCGTRNGPSRRRSI